jgi:hypothetical protein
LNQNSQNRLPKRKWSNVYFDDGIDKDDSDVDYDLTIVAVAEETLVIDQQPQTSITNVDEFKRT